MALFKSDPVLERQFIAEMEMIRIIPRFDSRASFPALEVSLLDVTPFTCGR
jgi:hypothetical protein